MNRNLEDLKSELKTLEKFSDSWFGILYNKIFPGYIDKRIQSIQLTMDRI